MCGRYTNTVVDPQTVMQAFALSALPANLVARYNVAPTQTVPVVIEDQEGKRRLSAMRWGLIPKWAKDMSYGSRMINARAETITEKRSFKDAFQKQRCLVVADGFYEWKTNEDGSKTPMYVCYEDRRLFGLAGIWERWKNPEDGEILFTFSIVTTEPNELLKTLHHRMAVILPPEQYGEWLNPEQQDSQILLDMMRPIDAAGMIAYPVSKKVNRATYDTPELIEPIEEDESF